MRVTVTYGNGKWYVSLHRWINKNPKIDSYLFTSELEAEAKRKELLAL